MSRSRAKRSSASSAPTPYTAAGTRRARNSSCNSQERLSMNPSICRVSVASVRLGGRISMITRSTLVRVFAASLTLAALSGSAFANQHPHPHKGSLDYLDRNSYAHNMRVLGVFQLGEERGHKLQMMAIGPRRFILQNGDVIDVSDPRVPKLVKPGAFRGSQLQVAFNKKLGKWILVTGAS